MEDVASRSGSDATELRAATPRRLVLPRSRWPTCWLGVGKAVVKRLSPVLSGTAMNVSDRSNPPVLNQRKLELLEQVEGSLDEQDSWRQFNAAYHEDDLKFMRFLIPPGKRVLELGC